MILNGRLDFTGLKRFLLILLTVGVLSLIGLVTVLRYFLN